MEDRPPGKGASPVNVSRVLRPLPPVTPLRPGTIWLPGPVRRTGTDWTHSETGRPAREVRKGEWELGDESLRLGPSAGKVVGTPFLSSTPGGVTGRWGTRWRVRGRPGPRPEWVTVGLSRKTLDVSGGWTTVDVGGDLVRRSGGPTTGSDRLPGSTSDLPGVVGGGSCDSEGTD